MRYTHAMEDAKRRAVETIALGSKGNAGESSAIPVSRDHSATNEKRVADQIAVSGLRGLVAGGGIEPPTLGL